MKFVFEDDVLSKLFRSSLDEQVGKNIIYAKSSSNIETIIKPLLCDTDDAICIFMDLPPGNKELVSIYKNLSAICKLYSKTAIIIPIICMEYYFIKSIANFNNLFTNHSIVTDCVDKRPFFNSELIITKEDKKYCKYFERYCKLILMKNVKDCIRTECNGNPRYGFYYLKDCTYNNKEIYCRDNSLVQKSQDFIKSFIFTRFSEYCDISYIDTYLQSLHNKAVDDYNELVDIFKEADRTGNPDVRYNHIKKLPFVDKDNSEKVSDAQESYAFI